METAGPPIAHTANARAESAGILMMAIGLEVARAEAASGQHGDWRAVQIKLLQLGFEDAPLWFKDLDVRCGIDLLCWSKRDRS
jgi:hypothetical protein